MTSLSCRRGDNAPRYCCLLRTFDFAGDCRVNFSGVCCIVAPEYEGRRSAATREGCLNYSSSASSSLPPPPSPLSLSFWYFPHVGPLCNARSGPRLPSLRRFQITGSRNGAPVVDRTPPVALSRKHARGTPLRRRTPLLFLLFSFFYFAARFLSRYLSLQSVPPLEKPGSGSRGHVESSNNTQTSKMQVLRTTGEI